MSIELFLASVRVFCVFQFALTLLIVMIGGIHRSEMVYIIFSAVFGLLCDGFCRTVIRARVDNEKKKVLDKDFDHLMDELNTHAGADVPPEA